MQYNSWFTFSEFEEPVTPRSCRPIHARELTMVSQLFYFPIFIFTAVVSSGLYFLNDLRLL